MNLSLGSLIKSNKSSGTKCFNETECNLINLRMELKKKEKLIKAQLTKCEEEIKNSMGNFKEAQAGHFKITYKDIISTTFDKDSFKKDYPTLYEKYQKKSESKRLNIKEEIIV